MPDQQQLGKLERVAIRDVWKGEAQDFTPWLAEESNLALLGEAIGIDLELVDKEVNVGDFRLDILANRIGSEESIVIENQFGRTDHSHLGQLLTYAAGIGKDGAGAKAVVWLAETFAEPHRGALDWLNRSTEPGIRFFGIEIELWRIGQSLPAPKFNLVSKPNPWQKEMTQQTSKLAVNDELYMEFWSRFIDYCQKAGTTLNFPNPWGRTWLPTRIGRGGFGVNLNVSKKRKKLECHLWIDHPKAKAAFSALLEKQDQIIEALGKQTAFDEMNGRQSCKIFETIPGDVTDREQWPKINQWLKDRGEAYVALFTPLVKQLDLD